MSHELVLGAWGHASPTSNDWLIADLQATTRGGRAAMGGGAECNCPSQAWNLSTAYSVPSASRAIRALNTCCVLQILPANILFHVHRRWNHANAGHWEVTPVFPAWEKWLRNSLTVMLSGCTSTRASCRAMPSFEFLQVLFIRTRSSRAGRDRKESPCEGFHAKWRLTFVTKRM